jgi:hypothetical protein
VLALKFASPLYFAVMECEPMDKPDEVICAAAEDMVTVPTDELPS